MIGHNFRQTMHSIKIIFLWTKDFWFQNFSTEIIRANSCAHQLITYWHGSIIGLELQIIYILLKVYCRQNPFFFSLRVLFHRHWRFTGQQGKGGGHLLFLSTTATRSRTLRHLFATLHVRWLSRIFNRNASVYQTATMRFTTLSNYHLSDWLMMQCLFVYLMNWY